jgi:hypothetical protein
MKEYEWGIHDWTGVVKARNMKSALVKAIKAWVNRIPFPPKDNAHLDLFVKEIKRREEMDHD